MPASFAEFFSSGALQPILLILAMIVVFYFLLIRPQRKKDKQVKTMLSDLKPGDRITTIGGIYATITNIKDDVLTVSVGPEKQRMMIARWAVRALEDTPNEQQNDAALDSKK